ncbi:NAD(P)/FAD-dependent oxidoreductase [Reichenbachiella sp. MALMAid0571]|uniref:NAD(P)/FAD-dependent oxidoreductase n=1 Tax=Reichenbachiella sp. MALMAid0571 TaxID=3143939 RepID=UPI0032DFDFE0
MTDIAIVGGGLAGLINAILLARKGVSVVLFEKKNYPFHRVCGEYISNEVVPFLKQNGLYPDHLAVAQINKFLLTSTNGRHSDLDLDLGGFGISRYELDHFLFQKAIDSGVDCRTGISVENVEFSENHFNIQLKSETVQSKLVIGAFGKRSKLDKKLNRSFIQRKSPYLAVKYHIKTDFPDDTIALHNFKGGYCGMSKVENDTYNLCYLSASSVLKESGNIPEMEEQILHKNPFLKSIFKNSKFVFDVPLVINEISFENKLPVENHILMSGDSAGMIVPLCGNGMAMAIHSAKILSETIINHWSNGEFDREKLESEYVKMWNKLFYFRLWSGRKIQALFGSTTASNLAVNLARIKPVANSLLGLTHGKEF